MTVEFIYEQLALIFDTPCNFSPIDEIMSDCEKCREDCGKKTDAECWQRFFSIQYAKCKESEEQIMTAEPNWGMNNITRHRDCPFRTKLANCKEKQ